MTLLNTVTLGGELEGNKRTAQKILKDFGSESGIICQEEVQEKSWLS